MYKENLTEQQISKFVEFRQTIYQDGFQRRREAQLELLDALVLKGFITSFPMLSCSTAFTRRWHSVYAAVEKGEQDNAFLRRYLAKQASETGIQFFSLDCTAWP